jgi:MFS family permease
VRPLAAYLRSLDPGLPRPVWLLQSGGLANAFGNGLAFPFMLIYLHNVRGISLSVAGLTVAANAAAGLVVGPVAGSAVDRFGARTTLRASLVLLAIGFGCLPLVREAWHAFLLSAIAGAGNGGFWPSQSSLTTALTPRERVHAAFGMQRVMNNLGIGIGAMVGGLIAQSDDPTTFTVIFLLDAATFLVFLLVLGRVPDPAHERGEDELPGTYAEVLRHRIFVAVLALNALFVTIGYGMIELLPVFAKNEAGISESSIALAFFVNTMTIVVLQLVVVRAVEGRRRMPAFALMGAVWAVSWVLVLVVGTSLESVLAVLVLCLAAGIFGIGECLHGAVQGALVADLSVPRLRGRYMALSATSWQVGFVIGPAIGGVVLDLYPPALWAGAAAACLLSSAASLAIEPGLPREARRTPARTLAPEPG